MSIVISAKVAIGIDSLEAQVTQIDKTRDMVTDWREGVVSLIRKLSPIPAALLDRITFLFASAAF
jgi:hypothetical protein